MAYKNNDEFNNKNTSRYFGYSEDYFVHFSNDIREKLINSYINFLINKKALIRSSKQKAKKAQQPSISSEELSDIIKREEEKKAKIKVLMRR